MSVISRIKTHTIHQVFCSACEGPEQGRAGLLGTRQRRTRRRRKANEGAQAAVTKMTATVEEDEAKTIATIDVGGMNNGVDDPNANNDGYEGIGDGDGVVMLANSTE